MSKRFVDTGRYRQAWRKLDPKFRAAYYWLTENCDPAGFWVIDLEHFKFECGYALDLDKFLKEVGGAVERHGEKSLKMVDFIEVNYGTLREGYNPHKPALRALAASTLTETNSSLNQASSKLEDEEEGEDEDEKGRGVGEPKRGQTGDPVFEALWLTFERYGSKGKALDYWKKLSEGDRAAIVAKAPAYVASTPGCEYRKQLEGWINPAERRWERPIVVRGQAQQPPTATPRATGWDVKDPTKLSA